MLGNISLIVILQEQKQKIHCHPLHAVTSRKQGSQVTGIKYVGSSSVVVVTLEQDVRRLMSWVITEL